MPHIRISVGNLSRDRQANARNAHKNRCGLTRGVAFISTATGTRRHHTCECEEAFHGDVKYNSSLRDKKEEEESERERERERKREQEKEKSIGR